MPPELSDEYIYQQGAVPRIFISALEDDRHTTTNRIYNMLIAEFGQHHVIKDMKRDSPETRLHAAIEREICTSDVMLIIIGSMWATKIGTNIGNYSNITNDTSKRVQFEIETGLQCKNLLIIPILIDNAPIPNMTLLPAGLKDLKSHDFVVINSQERFEEDIASLARYLRQIFDETMKKTDCEFVPLRIFISFSHCDQAFADYLYTYLEKLGQVAGQTLKFVKVWRDQDSIRPSTRWNTEIIRGLLHADVVVLIMSPDSIKSEWVRNEFYTALKHQIAVLPIHYRSVDWDDLDAEQKEFHTQVSNIQYLNFADITPPFDEHPNYRALHETLEMHWTEKMERFRRLQTSKWADRAILRLLACCPAHHPWTVRYLCSRVQALLSVFEQQTAGYYVHVLAAMPERVINGELMNLRDWWRREIKSIHTVLLEHALKKPKRFDC